MTDFNNIRSDFPILYQKINNRNLVYLDNSATTQKPQQVIDSIAEYYTKMNCNVHRSVHFLSKLASTEFESTRKTLCDFINAKNPNEIVFTS